MALSLLVLYCPGLSTPEQVTPNSNRVCVCVCCRAMLSSIYDEVCVVDILDSGDTAHLALMKRPDLGVTFTKLHCWTLTHYTKCVFMDADTLVSIRALTLLTQYKLQQVCIQGSILCVCVCTQVLSNIDELFEREELSAAPDPGWPDCFNSGVFVFKPSNETYRSLMTHCTENGSFDGEFCIIIIIIPLRCECVLSM